MPKEKVEVMVEAGKASAAPPLGPALGPLGVPIQNVIDEINRKTKDLEGMKVPVTVIVDTVTKGFEIKVGSPPAAALIRKELGIEKGSSETGKIRAGDLSEEQVKKVASAKFGSTEDRYVNQIKGTARSMGITIGEGKLSEEEMKAAEEAHKKAAEEAAAAEAAAAAPAEGAPAEGEAPKEGEEAKEGEEKPEEAKEEEKPEGEKEGKKPKEKKE
ncbi:MAG: 50S ribosomal protein L11 [Candidatus Aenigmarchaeota archaeon]|nr:50S ribosomal protein L11 [Candidatus Aenigmarchaeota archaeon]NIP40695.1 50S ribosomal protein L11 [Candidatus Aenigmarchaeota archaeon]NIQ18501.1 50S ribosomal protein L11 [Candidatus Aenigmarchaeota archaeon]NIS73400.1 50S ribosomal protein L11 [Candidatus Aenigmarchaeota archaeon]